MTLPNIISLRCEKCKISSHCPVKGSSPMQIQDEIVLCRIIGGYGKKPIRLEALSQESIELQKKHGPCFSIAEVPRIDTDSGHTYTEIVKIWHPEMFHPREKTNVVIDGMYPRSHKR